MNDNQQQNSTDIDEITSSLKSSISNLTKQMDQYVNASVPAMKRKSEVYESVASFFDNLNYLLCGTTQVLKKSSESISTASGHTGYRLSSSRYTKDEVIAAMRSMRKDGATYSEIADWLVQEGIPTFSGRGEWSAQTVHRLCK